MKNKITLYVGCGKDKKKVELYNFSKVDHYEWNIRVLCDNRFYYFPSSTSVISEIEIYE